LKSSWKLWMKVFFVADEGVTKTASIFFP